MWVEGGKRGVLWEMCKWRRELYHLYEQVLSKAKTARILVRVLFLFLTRFHVNVARSNGNSTRRALQRYGVMLPFAAEAIF